MQLDLVTILAVTALFLALCIAYKTIKISFKWNNIEFNIEASRENNEKEPDAPPSDSEQE